MTDQHQGIDGSHIQDSQIQQSQAGRDAVSFQNSQGNWSIIINICLQLFGSYKPAVVDWETATNLLEDQLPEIRARLRDTLGRDRHLLSIMLEEEHTWVGRSSPLQAERQVHVQGENQGVLDPRQLLIETFGQDDIEGKLLILGAPGAGKTTALLSLAEQLVCGAIALPETVIPVIFELSTWRNDNQSIEDWLVEQLYELYGGNRRSKRYEQWLERRVLLPLLDGLDELGMERQKLCTQKLNEFAKHYPKLVICCRSKEFKSVGFKLKNLRGCVLLKPLSNRQIKNYLETIQQPQLWSGFQTNPALMRLLSPTLEGDPGLLRIPLFLSLAAQIYDHQNPFQSKVDLLRQYEEYFLSQDKKDGDRRKELENYKWAYSTIDKEPTRQQTYKILSKIAWELKRSHQVELLVENLQPQWLEKSGIRTYQLMVGLLVCLVLGSMLEIIVGLSSLPNSGLRTSIFFGLFNGIIFGTTASVYPIIPIEKIKISFSQKARRFFWEAFKDRQRENRILYPFKTDLNLMLILSFLGGLAFSLLHQPLFLGITCGPMYILCQKMYRLNYSLMQGLKSGLQKELKQRWKPNQGIKNSFINMLVVTFFFYPLGILYMLIFGLPWILIQVTSLGYIPYGYLSYLLFVLTILGLVGALYFSFMIGGGLPFIQHYCLRLVLWQQGIIPLNLPRFLNYCVERRLLQRVGGRYRFLHRELLDYFATQRF